MRKVRFAVAVSLDNYLAGPGEAMDWLRWTDDAAAINAEAFDGVDTMLLGRKTWQFAQRMGGGPLPGHVRTYVFSRTLESLGPTSGVELVSEDAAAFVRRLKAEPGGQILIMGGGQLGTSLIETGLVDEISLNVHPVLLGAGTPLYHPMAPPSELELIEARGMARECVLLRYRPRI